jgi:hypothetical protein
MTTDQFPDDNTNFEVTYNDGQTLQTKPFDTFEQAQLFATDQKDVLRITKIVRSQIKDWRHD